MQRVLIAAALVLGLISCSKALQTPTDPIPPPAAGISFTANVLDRDAVMLTLRNNSGARIGYNLCFSTLEQRTTSGWKQASVERHPCTAELRGLAHGDEATFRHEFNSRLAAGDYRFRTEIELLGSAERRSVESNVFTIR